MAESESGADKSEEPTEKRLRESREKGQLARSRELSTVAVTLGGIGGLLASGGGLAQTLMAMMIFCNTSIGIHYKRCKR